MSRPMVLSIGEIQEKMKNLLAWQIEDGMLQKEFIFSKYMDGVTAISKIAIEAEKLDHHPLLELGFKRLLVKISTHEPKGITDLDFELVGKIEDSMEKAV